MMGHRDTSIDFADVALMGAQLFASFDDDEKAKLREQGGWWIDLIRVGDFFPLLKGSSREAVKITKELLAELVANHPRLVEMIGSPRVDANHATRRDRNGSDTKTRARMPKVRLEGDVLQAWWDFTPLGLREVLDEEAWEGPSAEIAEVQDKQTGKPIGLGLIGATVTPDPMINGLGSGLMPAIALSELARTHAEIPSTVEAPGLEKEGSSMSHLKLLSEALGQDLTEDNMVERITAMREEAGKVPDLLAEVETLKADNAKVTADAEAVTADAKLLAERVGKLEAANTALDEAHAIEADLQRGAISKAEAGTIDEPGIARKIRRSGVELYADSYGARPDGYIAGGKPEGHNRDDRAEAKPADTASVTTQPAAEKLLCELAAREDGYDISAAIATINEKHAGEGDRLYALMLNTEGV